MKYRIIVIIPLLLVISTLLSSILMFLKETRTEEAAIRDNTLSHLKMDITRLQNILYNRLIDSANNIEDARLNLSVMAMDTDVVSLLLTDENNKVLVANHYAWEEHFAHEVSHYDNTLAEQVKKKNTPLVFFNPQNDSLLQGYYPVILQLQSAQGLPIKRIGVLFTEKNIVTSLAKANRDAIAQSVTFASGMLLVSAFIAVLLHWLLSKRLLKVMQASRALAAGNLDARTGLQGKDELAELGTAFDSMADRIKHDIARREQAEKELRELNDTLEQRINERTRLLQEAQHLGHIGNWHLDIASGKLNWSDEIYRIFGFQPRAFEPSYESFIRSVHPDDVIHIKMSEQQAFLQGSQHSIDHRIILPNGETRWVHEEAVVSYDQYGQAISMSGTVQDITERKLNEQYLLQAKEEAERASHAKSEFLSHMSHELRTPLNAILGFAQILNIRLTDAVYRSYADEINLAGKHLLTLIDELLDLGRIESGRMTIELTPVDLSQAILQAVNIVNPLIQQNRLLLKNQCIEKQVVIADVKRMHQVLVNLLSNAAKYNKQDGVIILSSKLQAEDRIRLSITDTGKGIHPDYLPKLFAPFERLGAETSAIDGTGIGLALSKQLVELMGGRIGVESKPEQGSTFWIEFPRTNPEEKPDTIPPDIHAATNVSKCRVLYIEDNPANLRLIEAMLKHHADITLLSATNGLYGLELARQYLPDIILLDIQLPDLDGYKVLKALQDKDETRQIPVIAVSADAMPIDVEKGLAAGFREYLTKPVKLEAVMQAIHHYSCR